MIKIFEDNDSREAIEINATVKIYLLTNCPLRRIGLEHVCTHEPGFSIVGTESEFPRDMHILHELQPDLIVVDQALFHYEPRTEAEIVLHQFRQFSHVIILADQIDFSFACTAIAEGAEGYLPISSSMQEILQALHVVALGGIWLEPSIMRLLASQVIPVNQQASESTHTSRFLSERELQILYGIARGQTNKEIANQLYLSESSVRTYWYRVLNKLNAINKAEAILIASQMGLLDTLSLKS